MVKKQIRVYPDYCSSGVWNERREEIVELYHGD